MSDFRVAWVPFVVRAVVSCDVGVAAGVLPNELEVPGVARRRASVADSDQLALWDLGEEPGDPVRSPSSVRTTQATRCRQPRRQGLGMNPHGARMQEYYAKHRPTEPRPPGTSGWSR